MSCKILIPYNGCQIYRDVKVARFSESKKEKSKRAKEEKEEQ